MTGCLKLMQIEKIVPIIQISEFAMSVVFIYLNICF